MSSHGLIKPGLVALALLAFVLFPFVFSNPTYTTIAVFTLIYMTSTTAWNGFAGYSGYIPLGHAAFFGTGAYTFAVIAQNNHLGAGYGMFGLIPLSGLVAGLTAIPVGLVALRTRRHTFVVITIAIFFLFQLVATNLGITGGSSGLQVASPNWPGATYNDPFYFVALGLLILAVAASWTIRRSRFGLQLLAIRDDEARARGLGVRVGRVKLTAFVISAIPIGMVGGVYAYFVGQVFPQFVFDPLFDLSIALMAFFGGLGTVWGPLLGGILLEPLQQYLTFSYSVGDLYLIIYGVIFLVVILLLPLGIVPSVSNLLTRRRSARDHASPPGMAQIGGDGDARAGLVAHSGTNP
ncbi:MAG: branched-chain amino acid ABC transporter permease [Candidatus Dormiibacterota bacterium]